MEWAKLAISVVALLVSIATFVSLQREKRQKVSAAAMKELKNWAGEKFDEHDGRLAKKSDRISKLEFDVGRIPTRMEFDEANHRVDQKITRLHERVDELNKQGQQTNLLIGQVLGELKQLNMRNSHG